MNDIADKLRSIVDEALPLLAGMTPEQVSAIENPGEWSKKEILGHLIDSAANNHQRFVRATANAAAAFPTYDGVAWVQAQRYQEANWSNLVALWSAYNRHLGDVIERLPAEALSAPCNVGQPEPAPLAFVIEDYLRHLRGHMNDILSTR